MQYTFKHAENNFQGKAFILNKVNDGLWHVLHVDLRPPQEIVFGLDSNHTTRFSYPNRTVHELITEISSKTEYLFGEDFIGCLGKIDFGGKSFVLTSSTSQFNVEATSSIQNGCIASDVCSAKPCRNNALNYCVDMWEIFNCVSPGQCEMPLRCHNNGRCVPVGSASFTCDCSRVQFGGDFCDVPLVCLDSPCSGNEVCSTKGVTYECVSMDTASNGTKDLLTIVLPILCVVFLLAVIIGCLSSKRRWKEKAFREEVFKGGFEDEAVPQRHGNEIRLNEYKNHAYVDDDDVYVTKQHNQLGRDRKTRRRIEETMENPSVSLPELRERPFAILKKKYRSEEYFQGAGSSNDVFNNTLQQTSDFNSSYSSDDGEDLESVSSISYVSTVQPEMYDMECASMQFSEMSFKHDHQHQPINKEIERLRHQNDGSGLRNPGYVSESSEAYFTSSEFDYKMPLKRGIRRPAAYVLSENKHVHRTIDQASETSSNLSWSHLDPKNTEKDPRFDNKENSKAKQDLRLPVLKSKYNRTINNNNDDDVASEMMSFHNGGHGKVLVDGEAEEFV